MCQERADIMYSVKETARKIMCPTESDEMNVKRIARYLKGVPIAKFLIEINRFPPFVNVYTDSDWAGQPRARARVVESHSGEARLFLPGQERNSQWLEICRSRIVRPDTWNVRRDGGKTSLERTGIRSDTREPCHVFSMNFTVSSEFTSGENLIPF